MASLTKDLQNQLQMMLTHSHQIVDRYLSDHPSIRSTNPNPFAPPVQGGALKPRQFRQPDVGIKTAQQLQTKTNGNQLTGSAQRNNTPEDQRRFNETWALQLSPDPGVLLMSGSQLDSLRPRAPAMVPSGTIYADPWNVNQSPLSIGGCRLPGQPGLTDEFLSRQARIISNTPGHPVPATPEQSGQLLPSGSDQPARIISSTPGLPVPATPEPDQSNGNNRSNNAANPLPLPWHSSILHSANKRQEQKQDDHNDQGK